MGDGGVNGDCDSGECAKNAMAGRARKIFRLYAPQINQLTTLTHYKSISIEHIGVAKKS